MVETREFPVEVVLSAVKGVLLCPIGDVYDVLGFLYNGPVWTHELPSVSRLVAPVVLREHPELDIDVSGVTRENWREWLDAVKRTLPATVTLSPIPDLGRMAGPLETAVEALAAARQKRGADRWLRGS